MKLFIPILTAVLLSVGGWHSTASAQSDPHSSKTLVRDLSTTTKFALGATTERHIHAAHKTYEQLVASGVQVDGFVIVIWGPVVKNLTKNTKTADFMAGIDDESVQFEVCQMAMDRLEVSADQLGEEVHPVPNAYIRLFQLQALGYNVIIP